MSAERAANGPKDFHHERPVAAVAEDLSGAEVMRQYLADPKSQGPARGIMAELLRIDPSGLRQTSAAVDARCGALGWELEHLAPTIGTVIRGPDLREPQSDEAIAAMKAVMLERCVRVVSSPLFRPISHLD